MGNFVASRGTNLLLIILLAGLVLNVDCVVRKSFERETEATTECVYKDYVAILTSDRTQVLTVLPHGKGVALSRVKNHPITLDNLFIKSATGKSSQYVTFTAYAKNRKLALDSRGSLTVQNNATTFFIISVGYSQYYFRALAGETDECREGDHLVSPYKSVQSLKLEKSDCTNVAGRDSSRDLINVDEEYVFHLEDVSTSPLLSEELKALCCY
ncbi:uncharacterized protein LOC134187918 [Corticium candelabrum]|uniref:uncharacterized protein LOC134187918 n=1 Tax=Corticium candelabrum TaxID=121492 RepID=UPI002E2767E7|nr:uncharacterized protein LOC134187918 [Corticium candelabrum]